MPHFLGALLDGLFGFSWVSQGMMTIPIQERLASLVPT